MKHISITLAILAAGLIAWGATGPGMPQPTMEVTHQVSDTNQTQQATASDSLAIFAGVPFTLTNCVLKDADGYIYGGTNYRLEISIGNADEGIRTYRVFGDGSTNYTDYSGAWTPATSYWAEVMIPSTHTNDVYMQVKVRDADDNSFIYPLRRIPYAVPLQP